MRAADAEARVRRLHAFYREREATRGLKAKNDALHQALATANATSRRQLSEKNRALEAAGMRAADVDWLLLHQANIRILETCAKKLGVPMEKMISNLDEYGNTSAGSIPLALDEAVKSGKVQPGDVIACAGFGAGLSWGAAVIRWDYEFAG